MNTVTPNTESMLNAMKRAIQQSNRPKPSLISALIGLLVEAQQGLRESGYQAAVLELRPGLQTDYGLRYTTYFRNQSAAFETPLFSIFVANDVCAFQAEGQLQTGLNTADVIAKAHDYLLQPHVVDLMTGLLRQFGRSGSIPSLDTP